MDTGVEGLAEAVETYLEWFEARPWSSDEHLRLKLIESGVDAEIAGEVVFWIPIAFGRALLHSLGVRLSPCYRVHRNHQTTQTKRLADDPVYAHIARQLPLISVDLFPDEYLQLAARSIEYRLLHPQLSDPLRRSNIDIPHPLIYRRGDPDCVAA